ncbi:MAG TPA: hypothetical protein VN495_01970 [Candidatus Paceibacterota bacterium]|nr:hypothetical protein [Candidatus Paceibacterota bacterium]
MNRGIQKGADAVVAGLEFLLWLPILTVDLRHGRIDPSLRERYGLGCGIAWLLSVLILSVGIDGKHDWTGIFLVDGFFYCLFGLMVVICLKQDQAASAEKSC